MYNTGCYINRFCLLWKKASNERQNRLIYQPILSKQDTSVKYTTQYCPRPTKPVVIQTIFVYDRQNRLIYQPILSTTEKTWRNTNHYWLVISLFCLSWTILVGISPYVVCDEQKWLVYHSVLSVMDSNGWYIS